ncbi:hypothetical protein B0H13DRAFT_1881654 [Mycena leptocephala]|nr:hypothetical protein B0H13DRAFT_1881654 [Mycena leptocephala]
MYPRISLVLEDSGNVARDHLASERTFLSYVRASLTIVSAAVAEDLTNGVALAQLLSLLERLKSPVLAPLRPLEKYARQLAVGTIIVALLVLFMGVFRYFTVQGALPEGKFPVTRFRLGLIAMALGAIVLTILGCFLHSEGGVIDVGLPCASSMYLLPSETNCNLTPLTSPIFCLRNKSSATGNPSIAAYRSDSRH